MNQGLICEDVHFIDDDPDQFLVRKATNKKSKKIDSWIDAVNGQDWHRRQLLSSSFKKVKHKPPYGKTWLKQLFAGQMGLSVLAIIVGLSIGIPLDSSTSMWDANTSSGYKRVCHDLQVEDPYLTVITQACGPWGNWSNFNLAKGGQAAMTVMDLRESNRRTLSLVNKIVKDRIRAKRHVFIEQPLGSTWLKQPECSDILHLIQEGMLLVLRVDGCCVGYRDLESGLPNKKPSLYVTTLLAAEGIFQGLLCDGSHQHEHLEGNNKHGSRTAQASVWPDRLNEMVLQAMIQQASAESTAAHNISEVFPSEVQPAEQPAEGHESKRRRRKGRVSQLTSQYGAPPVYLRPSQPALPDVAPVPALPDIDDQEPVQDDASLRASQVVQLDPVLNITEGERRRRWLTISPEIRKILRDLHVQFGHPTNTTLQRILRRQGAVPEALQGADLLSCDACGDSIRRRRPKPVQLPTKYVFNHHLQIDVFYARDVTGASFSFLNIVDDAASYQVVSCLGQSTGPPTSQAVLRHFLTWSSWAGLPQSIQVDRGKEYLAYFSDYLKEYGVEQETVPLEAPWQNGKVERAGALWKEVFFKTVREMQLQGLEDVITATTIVTQVRNSLPRSNGFSPAQWVLGVSEIRIPGSLLQEDEAQRLELLEAANDPTSAFARSLGIRESARVAQIRLDNDSRVRRALLHQSTPTRGPYPIGSYVYFYRAQGSAAHQSRGHARNYRWFGPARVIGVEARNQRRAEDPEPLTEGGQPHAYWLRYGPSVVLVTGEQLRFASEDELLAAHLLPEQIMHPAAVRGARNYTDLRGHTAVPLQDQAPALQFSPEGSGGASSASRPAPAEKAPGQQPEQVPPDPQVPMLQQPLPMLQSSLDAVNQAPRDAAEPEPAPLPMSTPTPSMPPSQELSRRPSEILPQAAEMPAPSTPLQDALRNPDRLDSHQYRPVRTEYQPAPGPYFTDEVPWNCPDLPYTIRLHQLRRMNDEQINILKEYGAELSSEEENDTFPVAESPADCFLTGRAASTEISLKNLNEEDRQKFQAYMQKEWDSWTKFGAVEIDKNSKPRLLAKAMQKKTGKSDAQIKKEFPFQAKSRLVVHPPAGQTALRLPYCPSTSSAPLQ